MDLTTLKKEELAAEYTRLTNQEPKTASSKAELIDEITKVNLESKSSSNDPDKTPPPTPGSGSIGKTSNEPEPEKKNQELKLKENEFLIVKKDRDGKVIDEQVTNREIWDNLGESSKAGWERKAPGELNS
jgi:hypothetical protein